MNRRVVVRMPAVALVALALTGCGSGRLKAATGLSPADQLLTPAAIQRAGAGPVRTLLQWWRYIQYNDLTDYLNMLTPALRSRDLHSQLFAYELPVSSRELDAALPYVVSVSHSGSRVTIYTVVAYHQLVGATQFVTVQVPQAFSLAEIRGHWYIDDDQFIAEQSRPALITAGVIPAAAAVGGKSKVQTPALTPAITGQPSVHGRSETTPHLTTTAPNLTTTAPSLPTATTTTAPGAAHGP